MWLCVLVRPSMGSIAVHLGPATCCVRRVYAMRSSLRSPQIAWMPLSSSRPQDWCTVHTPHGIYTHTHSRLEIGVLHMQLRRDCVLDTHTQLIRDLCTNTHRYTATPQGNVTHRGRGVIKRGLGSHLVISFRTDDL